MTTGLKQPSPSSDQLNGMKPSWFVHKNGLVLGPFVESEVTNQLSSGTLDGSCLVWSRSTAEWTPLDQWETIKNGHLASAKSEGARVWYCDSGTGQPLGPITEVELVQLLRGFENMDAIKLWTEGMKDWSRVFDLPNVLDLVGISRREHPRAPILGQAALTLLEPGSQTQMAPLQSISIGGLGARVSEGGLSRGDRVQILIKSPDLGASVHASGIVMYVARSGVLGIRFVDISAEAKTLIFDHVRKFTGRQEQAKVA